MQYPAPPYEARQPYVNQPPAYNEAAPPSYNQSSQPNSFSNPAYKPPAANNSYGQPAPYGQPVNVQPPSASVSN